MRLAALGLCLALACCNSPPGDLRTWRAEDHDHTTNPGQDQVVAGPDAGPSELARFGIDEVTVIAWRQNCVRCHGEFGRGDGPQGAMFKATDLTNASWQRSVTDEGIALTIKNGRGQMPPFGSLPASTLKTLVTLVRLLDASRAPQDDGTGEPSSSAATEGAAPNASAPNASAPPARSAAPRPAPSAR